MSSEIDAKVSQVMMLLTLTGLSGVHLTEAVSAKPSRVSLGKRTMDGWQIK